MLSPLHIGGWFYTVGEFGLLGLTAWNYATKSSLQPCTACFPDRGVRGLTTGFKPVDYTAELRHG